MLQTKAIINYLLGQIEADKENDFLVECFSNDENSEKFERVRDDLIENYLRGDLSKEDERQFENHFLADLQNLELYKFSKKMRAHLAENTQLETAVRTSAEKKSFQFGSWLVPAAMFGALLIAAFFIWQTALKKTEPEIAEVRPTPMPTVETQVSPAISVLLATEPTPSTSPKPTIKPSETPKTNIPVAPTPKVAERAFLAFNLPLISKGNNKENVLKINNQIKQVGLQTSKPFKDFPGYQVQIQSNNQVSWQRNFEKFPTKGKGQIVVNIPAENFKEGKHRFIIFGLNKDGTVQELKGTERFFAVEKEQ